MPYIDQDDRDQFEVFENALLDIRITTAGELNYLITQLILAYRHQNGLSYQTINDIVGALEGAKAEYQRRVVQKYEDQKIKENGDVY